MMSHHSLTPEDFRYAWANAYQRALLDVGEIQRRSGIQLAVAQELLELSSAQAERGLANLHNTGTVLIDQLKQASIESQSRIDAATKRLLDHTNWILEQEKKLHAESDWLKRQLAHERRKLLDERDAMLERSIWSRLSRLFKPRSTDHARKKI